jgi:hypothetical protein
VPDLPLPPGLRGLTAILLAVLGTGLCGPFQSQALLAQDPLTLRVAGESGEVRATLGPVLQTRGIQTSLQRGLPIRILVVTELWRDRLVDSQEGRHEWRASVRFDPLERVYLVETGEGGVFSAGTPTEAGQILSEELRVPLRPRREGRFYYLGRLEVETLSLSDLEELRRWLQGDLAPAVEGEGGGGVRAAVGRGFQRALVRVLGLPAERYQTRSPAFRYPPESQEEGQ